MVDQATGFHAVVEIMGHKRYAGFVSEQVLGGASFGRVDVPAQGERAAFSKLFGAASIYCITPVSEDAANIAASKLDEQPLTEWDLPQAWRQALNQGRLSYDVPV
jgi:hypothetical protein